MNKKSLFFTGIGIVAVLIGWWLLSPLFLDKQVNEPLPGSANASGEQGEMMDDKEDMGSDEEAMKDDMEETMKDEDKEGMSDMEETMEGEDKEGMSDMEETMEGEDKEGMSDMEETMEGEDKEGMSEKEEMSDDASEEAMNKDKEMSNESYAGTFVEVDNEHNISGNAFTVTADGKMYIRFEQFSVTNGPDLKVYLTKEGQPTSEGVDLGKLKGNQGDQNYEIPEGVDLSEYNKVVVWCRAFDVDFGYAMLEKQ
ncbi:DM13 domain-containing protein [Cytobacillus sp. IB215316]|uniref:DM13 domain-containing protein n=1 Tax=Cytobacillus sp. IB215316 TaxID=3097354 RepID=UPI002A17D48E|nr:DM13 domain-containing protein [Cytobacillus sp. IB215316]MDX8361543.1 DM13 domain-containing protein [Cytobacillus sp. IB215316]